MKKSLFRIAPLLPAIALLSAPLHATETTIALDLTGGDQTVTVPAGDVYVVSGITANIDANIYKDGDGVLVMTNATYSSSYSNLVVSAGLVEVDAIASFGKGTVTLASGGGLRVTTTLTLEKTVNITDSCVLDIPSGITVTIRPNCFKYTGKTMTKTGAGSLKAQNYSSSLRFNGSGYWIIEEGTLTCGRESNTSSAFIWTETDVSGLTVEVHEGATFSMLGAAPTIVLRGGTLSASGNGYGTGTGDVADPQLYSGNSSPVSFYLNGGLFVLPSLDGRPSRILGNFVHFSQRNNADTIIDVQEGAVLEVFSTFSPRLQSTSDADIRMVRKTGKGQMRLHRPIRAKGTLYVDEGVLYLGRGARIDEGFSILPTSASATIQLEDGSAFNGLTGNADPFLSTAEVWIDPSRYIAKSGTAIPSLPNYGTLGGAFYRVGLTEAMYFRTNAIHGLPAVYGSAAGILLSSYENQTTNLTTFVVAQNTSWENENCKGKGGSPIQVCVGNSNPAAPNMFNYLFNASNAFTVVFGSTTKTFTDQGIIPGDTTPFLNEAVWSGKTASFRQYWSDDADPLEWSGSVSAAFGTNKFHWVSIGAKCYSGGVYGNRAANAMVGHIGEVLVFNRVLSSDETAYVRSYLQRKWFGSTAAAVALPGDAEEYTATIEVADGDSAAVDLSSEGGVGDVLDVAKTGDGSLTLYGQIGGTRNVAVEEGVLGLSSNRWQTFADVWIDPSDTDTVTLEDGYVVAVTNKGTAGGLFTPIATYSGSAGHTVLETTNSHTYLSFPGNAGLVLSAYTNYDSRITSPLCVYAVLERTTFVSSAGPFSFADGDATDSDSSVAHTFHYEDGTYKSANTRITMDVGSADTYVYSQADTSVPFLDVFHIQRDYVYYSQITASVTPTNGPRASYSLWDASNHVNRIVLGGRMYGGTLDGYTRVGSRWDRGWKGRVGEFVVFSKPLSRDDERELLWYLYNKWIAGTDGGALPEVLGLDLTPDASEGSLSLTFKDGTALEHSAPTVDLASLNIQGEGVWTRTGPTDEALFDVEGSLTVNGTLAFAFSPFPKLTATLIRYGSLAGAVSPNSWTLVDVPGRKPNASIRNHAGSRTVDLFMAGGLFLYIH